MFVGTNEGNAGLISSSNKEKSSRLNKNSSQLDEPLCIQIVGTTACDRYRNIESPSRISSDARARSSFEPAPGFGSSLSISLAFLMKRIIASATIAVPTTISVNPAKLPNFCPAGDSIRPEPESAGATVSRNRSKRSTRKPKAMTAIAVLTQARKVRSFAA